MSERTILTLMACGLFVLWVAGPAIALVLPNLITALCAVADSIMCGVGMAHIIGMWQIESRRN